MKLLSLTIVDSNNTSTKILPPGGIPSNTSLGTLIGLFLNILIVVGIVIALFYVFYGGWLWIVSGGDKAKIEKARMTIIYTLIGVMIMAISIIIINIVSEVLGIDLIKFTR